MNISTCVFCSHLKLKMITTCSRAATSVHEFMLPVRLILKSLGHDPAHLQFCRFKIKDPLLLQQVTFYFRGKKKNQAHINYQQRNEVNSFHGLFPNLFVAASNISFVRIVYCHRHLLQTYI